MADTPDTVRIDVKSAWTSKINWTQAIAVLASIATVFGLDVDPETQVAIVAGITGVQAVITWVLRTWFTTAVTEASAAKVA